jgi:hypothetical protein
MRLAFFFMVGLIGGSSLPAQQPSVNGPVEAFTFDSPTRSLRAVTGIPGGATFGPALLDNLDVASVAPLLNYGVIFQNGKCLFVSGLGTKTISSVAIAGVTKYPDGILWSGNGSLAVLYSLAGGWIQSIGGFPAAPVAGTVVSVSSLGGSFTALAVDAPGKQIIVAMSGDKGGVYESVSGQFTSLVSMANPVSLSFSGDGQTLYALDAAAVQVKAVQISSHGFQTLALPGMTNPVAIQSLEDSESRQVLYVAGGNDRVLRILDVASQQIITDVALYFKPTGLSAFGNSSFVLASRSQAANPLWLFSSTPVSRAYFVPAIQLLPPDHRAAGIAGRAR